MNEVDREIRIETARSLARTAQKHLAFACVMFSVFLFISIVRPSWWAFGFGVLWLTLALEHRSTRNHQLERLHRLGAIRWLGAPTEDFGKDV